MDERPFLATDASRCDVPQPGVRVADVPVLQPRGAGRRLAPGPSRAAVPSAARGSCMVEATAVSPEGRISPDDSGIWSDELAQRFAPIVAFIRSQGAAAGVQLAHAGRKASTAAPWLGGRPGKRGRRRLAVDRAEPRAVRSRLPGTARDEPGRTSRRCGSSSWPRRAARPAPASRSSSCTWRTATCCTSSCRRSPTAVTDDYGGSLENGACVSRSRSRPRSARPGPRTCLCSCGSRPRTGWRAAGTRTTRWRSPAGSRRSGVDLVDCSSGGLVPSAQVPVGPGYQTPFAATRAARGRNRHRGGRA